MLLSIITCNLYKNIKNLFEQNYTYMYRYTGKLYNKMYEVSTISLHQFGVSHSTQVIVQSSASQLVVPVDVIVQRLIVHLNVIEYRTPRMILM